MSYPDDPHRGGPRPGDEPRPTHPYSGPPAYGPPHYAGQPPAGNTYGQQPQYQAPQYQAPQYQQPQYQQPQFQPGFGAPPPQKKKGKGGKIALIVIGCIVAICLVGGTISAASSDGETNASPRSLAEASGTAATTAAVVAPPTEKAATETGLSFKVTGSGSAQITWLDDSFQTSQESAELPWSKTVDSKATPGVNISAQRQSGDNGSISCQILRDGEVIAKNSSSGPYAVVSCVINA